MFSLLPLLIIVFLALLAFSLGARLYGSSAIKQIQSGMFVGFGIACVVILIVEIVK